MRPSNPLDFREYRRRTQDRDCGVRGDYFRDQTAIIHSMAFRRLKHKTQVFFAPDNDHVCTRMEHVLHVATVASTICRGLNTNGWDLDSDLTTAIGLGHDLGHAPFGHAGERALSQLLGAQGPFRHEMNGYRVVELLANGGAGLNLTYAVKDGIICHNGESADRALKPQKKEVPLGAISDRKFVPSSYEGCIVRIADKMAYLGRDVEDAIRAKLIGIEDVPKPLRDKLGGTNGEIIDTLVEDCIRESKDSDEIQLSSGCFELMQELYKFSVENIYKHEILQRYETQATTLIERLVDYLRDLHSRNGGDYPAYARSRVRLDAFFGGYLRRMEEFYRNQPPNLIILDYVSGMTDDFALECMRQISIPEPVPFTPYGPLGAHG